MAKTIFDENSDISNICFADIYFYVGNTLTETFIEKHKDNISWKAISWCQTLSNKFIAKHIDKLTFKGLKRNKKIDQKFIEKLELIK